MAEETSDSKKVEDFVIRRLMKEGQITEEQARKLIADFGYQWPLLLREARFLAKQR